MQYDGTIGYIQSIGERGITSQTADRQSTADFGVGPILLAASARYIYLKSKYLYLRFIKCINKLGWKEGGSYIGIF